MRELRRHIPHTHEWYEDTERYDFLRKAFIALKFNGIQGDYAEFGCHGAHTFRLAYKVLSKYPYSVGPFHMWAFDSFDGLPGASCIQDRHPAWINGGMSTSLEAFNRTCRLAGIPSTAYTCVPGWYSDSLRPGVGPKHIRLAYIDCDMYSSAKAVLRYLLPRLQHGTIIAFDDYFCCSPTHPSGERMAMLEVFLGSRRLVPYVQFGWHGMSFVVESTDWSK